MKFPVPQTLIIMILKNAIYRITNKHQNHISCLEFHKNTENIVLVSCGDKLIKLCGSAQLKGIMLDNLIKGLVNSIYEHRHDVAMLKKS